jgi:hypothetical protein
MPERLPSANIRLPQKHLKIIFSKTPLWTKSGLLVDCLAKKRDMMIS